MSISTEQRPRPAFAMPEGLRHCVECETMSAEEDCFCCGQPTFDGPLADFCLHAIPVSSCSYQVCREQEARRRRNAARARTEAEAVVRAVADVIADADAEAA